MLYAEEFILIPRKTYAPDEKLYNNLKSLMSHQSMTICLSSVFLQRFRERDASRDYPLPLKPTNPIPLNPNSVVPNPQKKNICRYQFLWRW